MKYVQGRHYHYETEAFDIFVICNILNILLLYTFYIAIVLEFTKIDPLSCFSKYFSLLVSSFLIL